MPFDFFDGNGFNRMVAVYQPEQDLEIMFWDWSLIVYEDLYTGGWKWNIAPHTGEDLFNPPPCPTRQAAHFCAQLAANYLLNSPAGK